jgi:maltooligosyltrehalose trehalohydrolase
MHLFNLWAPKAKSVAVVVGGVEHFMECGSGGCWALQVEEAGPGSDYGFRLDGGDVLPDPRSAYQPYGVHGLSRLVDHASFPWTDKGWQAKPLASGIVYELHIGTFTEKGTFVSAIEKLDYLAGLGISHVEIMPVNEFSGDWGWGYDGADLYAPHHCYGTPDEFKALIDACHSKGLAVILDVVYNHLGPTGNYLPQFGPYFTEQYHTPWGAAVNLDQRGSDEARRFFIDNALMWLRDYHIDGLRLDAIHAFQDDSAVHFLEQLSQEAEELSAHLGRYLFLIAESDLNDPRVIRSRDAHGFGMDAQWSDDFHHALFSLMTGQADGYMADFGSFTDLATALNEGYVYSGDHSGYRGRRHGRRVLGLSGHHFVVFCENHDQVGNRAKGERIGHLVSPGMQKIAAALMMLSPFVPMLFMGEEFRASTPFQYFTHHDDPELGKKVSEGRRKEFSAFGWDPSEVPDPQDPETFQRSKLKWAEVGLGEHAEMLAWYKELIALRRDEPALTNGRMEEVEASFDETARWFVMSRGPVDVVCNFNGAAQEIPTKRGLVRVDGESVKVNKRS